MIQVVNKDMLKYILESVDVALDFTIVMGPIRSSKSIILIDDRMSILNEIDGTEDILTFDELDDASITNIGKAIKKGTFYYLGDKLGKCSIYNAILTDMRNHLIDIRNSMSDDLLSKLNIKTYYSLKYYSSHYNPIELMPYPVKNFLGYTWDSECINKHYYVRNHILGLLIKWLKHDGDINVLIEHKNKNYDRKEIPWGTLNKIRNLYWKGLNDSEIVRFEVKRIKSLF